MTKEQIIAISRVISDMIKADNIIEETEIQDMKQLMSDYSLTRQDMEAAQNIKLSDAIPVLRVLPKKVREELVNKIIASAQFGAAYACIRQLNFGYLDMAWHTITAPVDDPVAFEKQAIKDVLQFPVPDGCAISPQFSHIFSGGYAAGYYSYKWAEVLDADAFAAFKEHGIFDPATARSFKENILMKGGTVHPMTLYKAFRGKEPTVDALLARDGIAKPTKKSKKSKK